MDLEESKQHVDRWEVPVSKENQYTHQNSLWSLRDTAYSKCKSSNVQDKIRFNFQIMQ